MLLEGKTAVVTGSSKGLGRAFAMGLAKEGASVLVNGTVAEDVARVVAEIRSAGGKAIGCTESVATMAGAQHIIRSAIEGFGHLNILVNNAGVLRDRSFLKMTEEEWDTVMAVHLKGTFACAKFAALHMTERESGRIINISSVVAWQPNIGQCNYAAAKAGILGLTYGLALEMARYKITVNAVAPRGLTRMTIPLQEGLLERTRQEALKKGTAPPSSLDLGYGEPELAAPIVVYLASDEAKDITGKVFRTRGETFDLVSRNEEITSATMVGGWTVAEVRKRLGLILGKTG